MGWKRIRPRPVSPRSPKSSRRYAGECPSPPWRPSLATGAIERRLQGLVHGECDGLLVPTWRVSTPPEERFVRRTHREATKPSPLLGISRRHGECRTSSMQASRILGKGYTLSLGRQVRRRCLDGSLPSGAWRWASGASAARRRGHARTPARSRPIASSQTLLRLFALPASALSEAYVNAHLPSNR